jgi:hypothetical protein
MLSTFERKSDHARIAAQFGNGNINPSDTPPAVQVIHVLKDPDQAYYFLEGLSDAGGADVFQDLKALRRKIDRRIVPIMFCCYTMQFIDKVALNVWWTFYSYVCT